MGQTDARPDEPVIDASTLKDWGFDPTSEQIEGKMMFNMSDDWHPYRKVPVTFMRRMDGPFVVATSEGDLRCEDGFLAVDARGYPYPIDAAEQGLIYAKIDGTTGEPVDPDEGEPNG